MEPGRLGKRCGGYSQPESPSILSRDTWLRITSSSNSPQKELAAKLIDEEPDDYFIGEDSFFKKNTPICFKRQRLGMRSLSIVAARPHQKKNL